MSSSGSRRQRISSDISVTSWKLSTEQQSPFEALNEASVPITTPSSSRGSRDLDDHSSSSSPPNHLSPPCPRSTRLESIRKKRNSSTPSIRPAVPTSLTAGLVVSFHAAAVYSASASPRSERDRRRQLGPSTSLLERSIPLPPPPPPLPRPINLLERREEGVLAREFPNWPSNKTRIKAYISRDRQDGNLTDATSSTAVEITIPDGWKSRPRETNYYAVPLIVAMSVLVALLVISTVVGSAIWRRNNNRRRRKHPGEIEKGPVQRFMTKAGIEHLVNRQRSARSGRKEKELRVEKNGASAATNDRRENVQDMSSSDRALETASIRGSVRSQSRGSATGSGGHDGNSGLGRPIGGYRISTASTIARLRRRRERRAARNVATDEIGDDGEGDVDGDGDDEHRALTGSRTHSSNGGALEGSLTARLAARLRAGGGRPSSGIAVPGPSIVFQDLERARTVASDTSLDLISRISSHTSSSFDSNNRRVQNSYTSSPSIRHLDRQPSTTSLHSMGLPSPILATSSLLSTPALDPVMPNVILPVPGPPAYRPASSTIASTTRFSPSRRLPLPPAAAAAASSSHSQPASPPVEDPEDLWHWPNEKGRDLGASTSPRLGGPASSSSPHFIGSNSGGHFGHPTPSSSAAANDTDLPDDPLIYTAHVATDDKAVLARLQEHAVAPDRDESTSTASRNALLASATAPILFDETEEDEGFWSTFDDPVYDPHGVPALRIPAPSAPIVMLPTPSVPVTTHFNYVGRGLAGPRRRFASTDDYENAEMGYLPVYNERSRGQDEDENVDHSRILARADAPPLDLLPNDDVDDDSSGGDGIGIIGMDTGIGIGIGMNRLEHSEV